MQRIESTRARESAGGVLGMLRDAHGRASGQGSNRTCPGALPSLDARGSVDRDMSQRSRALVAFIVALLVVVACGVSLVHAANVGTDVCSVATGWGPAKTDTGSSGSLLVDLAPIPVGISGSAAPVLIWDGFPDLVDRVAVDILAEPLAPRAPPVA